MRTKEVKHIAGDGTETTFTRLFADEGKVLTNGTDFYNCVDVLSADGWREVDEDEAHAEEAITRYANELTGADDPDLISAAETLIKQRMEE